MGKEGQMHSIVKTYSLRQAGSPQMGGYSQLQDNPSERERGSRPHSRLPSPETPHQEDKPPEHLALIFLSGE